MKLKTSWLYVGVMGALNLCVMNGAFASPEGEAQWSKLLGGKWEIGNPGNYYSFHEEGAERLKNLYSREKLIQKCKLIEADLLPVTQCKSQFEIKHETCISVKYECIGLDPRSEAWVDFGIASQYSMGFNTVTIGGKRRDAYHDAVTSHTMFRSISDCQVHAIHDLEFSRE